MPQAKYIGIQEVLTVFQEKAVKPYWAIFQNKVRHEYFAGDDMDDSFDALQKELQLLKKRNWEGVLTLCLYDKKPDKKLAYEYKDQYLHSLYFALQDDKASQISAVGYVDNRIYEELNYMKSELAALRQQRLKDDEDEDEDEDEQPDKDSIGRLKELLDHPVTQTAVGWIAGIISKNNDQKPNKLGAINEDWEACVNILFQKGVTLEHLQKLAAMPESKIQMLLAML